MEKLDETIRGTLDDDTCAKEQNALKTCVSWNGQGEENHNNPIRYDEP